jgi:hypothetical protein
LDSKGSREEKEYFFFGMPDMLDLQVVKIYGVVRPSTQRECLQHCGRKENFTTALASDMGSFANHQPWLRDDLSEAKMIWKNKLLLQPRLDQSHVDLVY